MNLLIREELMVPRRSLNGFILHFGVFDSDRTLKNTDTLKVLVKNSFDVFHCPEGVLPNKNQ